MIDSSTAVNYLVLLNWGEWTLFFLRYKAKKILHNLKGENQTLDAEALEKFPAEDVTSITRKVSLN
jgi:hypothetical protein